MWHTIITPLYIQKKQLTNPYTIDELIQSHPYTYASNKIIGLVCSHLQVLHHFYKQKVQP